MASIENKVENLIKEKIQKLGYELYDVEYSKESKNFFLRIYIDSSNGIDLKDCETVSNEINDLLDKENIISGQYFLEVSSPGIERILRKDRHLQNNIGTMVEIKLFKKDEQGNKFYTGILKGFDDDKIEIQTQKDIYIDRKNIAQIKTVYNWDN